jgi:tetratricopeptide (TPR) repeat protein
VQDSLLISCIAGKQIHDRAEAALRAAIAQEPHPVDLWHALGHVLRARGALEEALACYDCAIAYAARYHAIIHFEHSAMLLRRAILHYEAGTMEVAAHDVTAALFQDHTNVSALHLQTHGYDTAATIPFYTACLWTARSREAHLQRIPAESVPLSTLEKAMDTATALWLKGERNAAHAAYRALQAKNPENPLLLHRLAWMSSGAEAMDGIVHALAAWSAYHRTYHRGAALHFFHRGEVYREMGEETLANMDTTRACDMDTTFIPAL